MKHTWTSRQRPLRLERRLEFDDYEATRAFLERAARLSERTGIYPDISFGKTYVNITLHAEEEAGELGEHLHRFASELDALTATEDEATAPPNAAPNPDPRR
ncbi:MAG: 4a-hydroxytetrahydrobiopterin dehydratase [Thiocapsa sp.]|jgi:pterin-4a-carbinolamine dehydratase|nr:4a-hydroxytetrahydrobiopterin dehydratase [Thiocapsa sp.]MCG6897675.1 4a-hydroxytetrahydrobiopterin dehydratase [Thiocapsa sp.]MCG6984850.1 4a-hydroxytetrahydrobiopterin dehydratase [Thiocapsa sp.]